MPNLTISSVCLNCEEVFDNVQHPASCPVCASEVTCPLAAWIPPLQWVKDPPGPTPGPASPIRPWLAVDNGPVEARRRG